MTADSHAGVPAAWVPVLQDLLELDMAGELAPVRDLIATRLARLRAGRPDPRTLDDLGGRTWPQLRNALATATATLDVIAARAPASTPTLAQAALEDIAWILRDDG